MKTTFTMSPVQVICDARAKILMEKYFTAMPKVLDSLDKKYKSQGAEDSLMMAYNEFIDDNNVEMKALNEEYDAKLRCLRENCEGSCRHHVCGTDTRCREVEEPLEQPTNC